MAAALAGGQAQTGRLQQAKMRTARLTAGVPSAASSSTASNSHASGTASVLAAPSSSRPSRKNQVSSDPARAADFALGFLRRATTGSSTRALYIRALAKFDEWCLRHNLPRSPLAAVGSNMERYFESLAMARYTPAEGRNVLFGYLKFRVSNRALAVQHLDPAFEALKGWKKLILDVPKEPMPEEVFLWLLEWMATNGAEREATAALLSLETHARPSEILTVHRSDFTAPRPQAGRAFARSWALTLMPLARAKPSKTGTYDDTVTLHTPGREFVTDVVQACHAACAEGPIFEGVKLADFEKAFRKGSVALSLQPLKISPHSARHSGASNDVYLNRRSLDQVRKRGRWTVKASVDRYERHGRLLRQFRRCTNGQLAASRGAALRLKTALVHNWSSVHQR